MTANEGGGGGLGSVEYYSAAWEDQANFRLTQLKHSVPPPPQTLINLFFFNENCCMNSLKLVYLNSEPEDCWSPREDLFLLKIDY